MWFDFWLKKRFLFVAHQKGSTNNNEVQRVQINIIELQQNTHKYTPGTMATHTTTIVWRWVVIDIRVGDVEFILVVEDVGV